MTTLTSATRALSSLKIGRDIESNSANITTINFAVELPQSLLSFTSQNQNQRGVVGTITFLGESACMVWVGWGNLHIQGCSDGNENEKETVQINSTSYGMPTMGPLVVAMPRTKYAGMSGTDEAPCSQLIGGDNEEDIMIGNSMACRLTQKVGKPVFVSGSLESGNGDGGCSTTALDGLQGNAFGDINSLELTQQACSLAEKEIGRIILEWRNGKRSQRTTFNDVKGL